MAYAVGPLIVHPSVIAVGQRYFSLVSASLIATAAFWEIVSAILERRWLSTLSWLAGTIMLFLLGILVERVKLSEEAL